MAVHRIVKQYHELGIKDRPRSVNTSRTRKMIKRILRDNNGSMRKLVSDFNISPISMRIIVKHDMGGSIHIRFVESTY
uniref:HTH_Tnp_Tc3_2 domain-containing protein n=1 Tax=Heterorhabditis bacteriophora TaxID=37862 RepID=A0A1I7XGE2_HETBA